MKTSTITAQRLTADRNKWLVTNKDDMATIVFAKEVNCSADDVAKWEEIDDAEYQTLKAQKDAYDLEQEEAKNNNEGE
jgi:hypothetical protein